MIALAAIVVGLLGVALIAQTRTVTVLRDQLDYQEERDRVGDMGLERELRLAHRRIAGLLASPSTYLRARRMLGPLDLDHDELTAELELISTP